MELLSKFDVNPTIIPEELRHMIGTNVEVSYPRLYKKSS